MKTGFPCKEKLHRETPVFITGMGLQCGTIIPFFFFSNDSQTSKSEATQYCVHGGLQQIKEAMPKTSKSFVDCWTMNMTYRMRAIITSCLYIFYPIVHCSLYCRAVSVTGNICTKQGNSSIFGSKSRCFKSRAGYNGACTIAYDDIRSLATTAVHFWVFSPEMVILQPKTAIFLKSECRDQMSMQKICKRQLTFISSLSGTLSEAKFQLHISDSWLLNC